MADFLSKIGGLFGGAQSSLYPMSEDERRNLGRMGLLQAGLAVLANNNNANNPMGAIGSGLLAGVQGIQQGQQDHSRQRYNDAVMQRTVAGMDRNSQIEALRGKIIKADGTIDDGLWPQYVAADPEGAKQIRDALGQSRKNPGQPVYLRDATGQFEDPYVWDDQAGGYVPAGNFLARGPLAGAASAVPQIGIVTEPQTPAAGVPMMGQAFYDAIGSYIEPFGAVIGSTDGGQHNVGSLHYDGRALDIPMGASASATAKANADQIIAGLQAQGYKVRDERTRPAGQAVWGGPHLHVESGQAGQTAPTATPFGRRPVKMDEPKERFRTLTPEEVAQYGLPPGTIAQVSPSGKLDTVHKPSDRGPEVDDGLSPGERKEVRKEFFGSRQALQNFQRLDQALADIPQGGVIDAESKGRLGTAYNNARAALRLVYNTGVLQPGELPMLESALRDPSGYNVLLDPRVRGQMRGQLDELYRALQGQIQLQMETYPGMFNPERAAESKRLLDEARNAVMRGKDKGAVRQRLIELGYPNAAKVL